MEDIKVTKFHLLLCLASDIVDGSSASQILHTYTEFKCTLRTCLFNLNFDLNFCGQSEQLYSSLFR